MNVARRAFLLTLFPSASTSQRSPQGGPPSKGEVGIVRQNHKSIMKAYGLACENPTEFPVYLKLATTKILDLYVCMESGSKSVVDVKYTLQEFERVLAEWREVDQASYMRNMDVLSEAYTECSTLVDLWLTMNGMNVEM